VPEHVLPLLALIFTPTLLSGDAYAWQRLHLATPHPGDAHTWQRLEPLLFVSLIFALTLCAGENGDKVFLNFFLLG